MKFKVTIATVMIAVAPGLSAAFASEAATGFCRKVEGLLRQADGFRESAAHGIVSKISASGLMSLGPSGKELPPDVLQAVQRDNDGRELYEDYRGGFHLLEFGRGVPLFSVESIAGTAACQTLWFFRRSDGGKIERVPGPGEVVGGCAGDFARMGLVAGEPVIVTEEMPAVAATRLKFLAWRRGIWRPLCSMSMTYEVDFDVTEEQCSGRDCAGFRSNAPIWGEAVWRATASKSIPPEAGLVAVPGISEKDLNARNYQTGLAEQPNRRAPGFLWNSPLYSVELAGKPYHVRIGRVDWGATVSSDEYLVTVFDGTDFSSTPLAGYVLRGHRKALSSIEAE